MRGVAMMILLVPLALLACKNPADDKPKAAVGAASGGVAEAPKAGAEALAFSGADSTIEFVGSKVTGKHDGGFKTFTGTISLVEGQPEASQVTLSIEMDSVWSDVEKLTGHLKSPDFFDVAKFPKATFTSTAVKAQAGPDGATHLVTGDLDLHGAKKAVSFPATIAITPGAATVSAQFSINRKDFGIVYPGMPDDLIRDDVLVKLSVKAARKS